MYFFKIQTNKTNQIKMRKTYQKLKISNKNIEIILKKSSKEIPQNKKTKNINMTKIKMNNLIVNKLK